MKTTALAFSLLCISALAASAADLPSRRAPPVYVPPPPPPALWTGFYAGIDYGATVPNSTSASTALTPISNLGIAGAPGVQAAIDAGSTNTFGLRNRVGAIFGGQVGYNYQFATQYVAGLEADIQGFARNGENQTTVNSVANPTNLASIYTSAVSVTQRIDYFGTVRGRLGYVFFPDILIYATGGLAYGELKSQTSLSVFPVGATTVAPATTAGGINSTRAGYTVGAGGEWMFTPNWSFKVEYLYYNLGSVGYSGGTLNTNAPVGFPFTSDQLSTRLRYDGNIARVGFNYHFNTVTPVVARY